MAAERAAMVFTDPPYNVPIDGHATGLGKIHHRSFAMATLVRRGVAQRTERLLQRAEGYLHTFVNGEEVYADGEPCGALPGRLVRGSGMPVGVSTGA